MESGLSDNLSETQDIQTGLDFISVTTAQSSTVMITDTAHVDFSILLVDESRSPFSPLARDEVLYFPTTIYNSAESSSDAESGKTGIVAVNSSTQDTIWAEFLWNPSEESLPPLIGSMDIFQDTLIIMSVQNGLFLFDTTDGTVIDTIHYSQEAAEACSINRDLLGGAFSALHFMSAGGRLAFFKLDHDFNVKTNRCYDIIVSDLTFEPYVVFSCDHYGRQISIGDQSYCHEGEIAEQFLTDSSLCFYTIAPELFFEITFDGRLVRSLFIRDIEIEGPVLPLAPPYIGQTVDTKAISLCPVMFEGHLYTMKTGIDSSGEDRAELLEINLENCTSTLFCLNTTLGWKKMSIGDGFLLADFFEIPEPNESGLYPSTRERSYAYFRL